MRGVGFRASSTFFAVALLACGSRTPTSSSRGADAAVACTGGVVASSSTRVLGLDSYGDTIAWGTDSGDVFLRSGGVTVLRANVGAPVGSVVLRDLDVVVSTSQRILSLDRRTSEPPVELATGSDLNGLQRDGQNVFYLDGSIVTARETLYQLGPKGPIAIAADLVSGARYVPDGDVVWIGTRDLIRLDVASRTRTLFAERGDPLAVDANAIYARDADPSSYTVKLVRIPKSGGPHTVLQDAFFANGVVTDGTSLYVAGAPDLSGVTQLIRARTDGSDWRVLSSASTGSYGALRLTPRSVAWTIDDERTLEAIPRVEELCR